MSTKVVIIIAAAFILIMGSMGAGFYFMWHKMSVAIAQLQNPDGVAEAAEEEATEEVSTMGPIYQMDTLIVNLSDQGGKRYLRVTMELELSAPEVLAEIQTRLPQLRDAILMVLPTKQYEEIRTTEGKIALRDELIARMNTILKTGAIATIYFTEFVIQ